MNMLDVGSMAAGGLAAILWFLSAILPKYPGKFTSPFSAPSPELVPLAKALILQSRLNAAAAAFTALAVVCSLVEHVTRG